MMRLIEPTVKVIEQGTGLDALYEHIDYCAGICYNRKGVHDNPKKFVDDMVALGHMRPLEFGTVYLTVDRKKMFNDTDENLHFQRALDEVEGSKYSYSEFIVDNREPLLSGTDYVTTNYRVLVECDALSLLRFMTGRTKHHKMRLTVCWNLSRGIADEFRTHVTLSSLMKSTRYVNETKLGMEFVKPYWFVDENSVREQNFLAYCKHVEEAYTKCVNDFGMKPQEAREYLPLSLGTELYQCGVVGVENDGWNRFFKMRCDKSAHPDARRIAAECRKAVDELSKEIHEK